MEVDEINNVWSNIRQVISEGGSMDSRDLIAVNDYILQLESENKDLSDNVDNYDIKLDNVQRALEGLEFIKS